MANLSYLRRALAPWSGDEAVPWQAVARDLAQRAGLDPRYFRRLRWLQKAHAVRAGGAPLLGNLRVILTGPEPANFTYEISNYDALSSWVANVAGCELTLAEAAVAEARGDTTLVRQRRAGTAGRRLWTKPDPPFGRRVGWYALARVLTPSTVIEVGAHDGLGSLILLRALERNAQDGHRGRLISFDVNPTAGWLVGHHPMWELRIESSQRGLAGVLAASDDIGLFIYDGWHTYAEERRDLELVNQRLAPGGVLVSDDAQVTHALADLCNEARMPYFEFQEQPSDHVHPGSVLGGGRRPR